MLEQVAAQKWNVKAEEVKASNHEVVHAASGRRIGYGELAFCGFAGEVGADGFDGVIELMLRHVAEEDLVILRSECVLEGRPHLLVDVGRNPLLAEFLALIGQLEAVIDPRGRCALQRRSHILENHWAT